MRFLDSRDKFTLISSTAYVEDYPVWESGTTYNTDDMVIYNNRIYKSLVDNNAGNEPPNIDYWFDEGATNPYRCLDEYVNTQTENFTDFEMDFDITASNAIAFVNTECARIELYLYDSSNNLVWDKTLTTVTNIASWEDYFFGQLEFINKFFVSFPFVFKGFLKVKIIGTNVKVGVLQIGYLQNVGLTLIDVSASIDDYSKKDVDDNGNVYLQEGNYADRTECKVILDDTSFNVVKKRLVNVRAQPIVWLASETDKYRELNLYGYYENFEFEIKDGTKTECKLTLRGLV
jgi:hypothetical protein